jgi:hypothetical protein
MFHWGFELKYTATATPINTIKIPTTATTGIPPDCEVEKSVSRVGMSQRKGKEELSGHLLYLRQHHAVLLIVRQLTHHLLLSHLYDIFVLTPKHSDHCQPWRSLVLVPHLICDALVSTCGILKPTKLSYFVTSCQSNKQGVVVGKV